MAEIPIQRKERRNIWPLLIGVLALAAVAWFVLTRNDAANTTAAARADSAAVAAGGVTTDSAAGATINTTGSTATIDSDIANVVHAVNDGEISAGKLAETRAQNADVKAYARDMVKEHSALDEKGAKIGGTPAPSSAALRDSVMNANRAMSAQLESARGAAFDKAYVDGQVTGHENALAFLQKSQNQVQNADLRKLIDDAIPDVQKHLERARALQTKLGR